MKIIKKSGDILGGILMVVSLILLIPLLLTNMGINSYIILSGSMEPVIRTGSMVLVDTQTENIQSGDIIMYRLQKENVVHRVVEIQEDGKIITKGDNNENADFAPVTQAQVCGKVIKMPWGLCIPYRVIHQPCYDDFVWPLPRGEACRDDLQRLHPPGTHMVPGIV